jgi:putative acetyltransferase
MNIRAAHLEDQQALLDIWERSVRASHNFLSDHDIGSILSVVRDRALPHLELWVLCNDASSPIGFMGLDDNKLEAMFISPSYFRQGGGSMMLSHARALKGPLVVDVNEQNPNAMAFYLSNGFKVIGRSPTDSLGLPFPLLHLSDTSHDAV